MKKNIRIHHECKGGIEKSVLRVNLWHHEACQVMANSDSVGQIFLSNPHTNNGFVFLFTIEFRIVNHEFWKAPNAKLHDDLILTQQ